MASEEDDEDTLAILARRRALIVGALAGLAISTEEACRNPFVAGSNQTPDTGTTYVGPTSCLSTSVPTVPTHPCLTPGGTRIAPSTPCLAPPRVCLSRVPPRACLSQISRPPQTTISPHPCLEPMPVHPKVTVEPGQNNDSDTEEG